MPWQQRSFLLFLYSTEHFLGLLDFSSAEIMWNWHIFINVILSICSKLPVYMEPKTASQADWIFPVPSITEALITSAVSWKPDSSQWLVALLSTFKGGNISIWFNEQWVGHPGFPAHQQGTASLSTNTSKRTSPDYRDNCTFLPGMAMLHLTGRWKLPIFPHFADKLPVNVFCYSKDIGSAMWEGWGWAKSSLALSQPPLHQH